MGTLTMTALIWFLTLCVALRYIIQDGFTKLSCAKEENESRYSINDSSDRFD